MKNSNLQSIRIRKKPASGFLKAVSVMAFASVAASSSFAQSAPDDLEVVSATDESVTLDWTPSAGSVDYYRIRVLDAPGGTFTRKVSGQPPYTVTNPGVLGPGMDLSFQIKTTFTNGDQTSYSSAILGSTTGGDGGGGAYVAPTVPQNVRATNITEDSITLAWNPSSASEGIKDYRIRWSGGANPRETGTSLAFDGLQADTNYTFEVRSYDNAGDRSGYSDLISVRTSDGSTGPDTVAPSVPQNLEVQGSSDNSVTLTWDASTDSGSGMDGYRIRIPGESNRRIGNVTSYTYEGLSANASYDFQIKAYDVAGNDSAYSSITEGSTSGGGGTGGVVDFYTEANLTGDNRPEVVGDLLTENLIARSDFKYRIPGTPDVHYAELNSANAAFAFAFSVDDDTHLPDLYSRYEDFDDDSSPLIANSNVARYQTALLLLEEYRNSGNNFYLNKLEDRAAAYWNQKNGWDEQDILDNRRFWADDFYLSSLVDTDYYLITEDPTCIDRLTRWLKVHLEVLQRGDGLVKHWVNNNIVWGRGCGWAALGLSEGLRVIPENHPDRAFIMQGYLDLMEAVFTHQRANGLWGQIVDLPSSWDETSGSAMFTYAAVVGINNGWLDYDDYGPATKAAWLAIVDNLDAEGNLADVCEGTNVKTTNQGYLDRNRYDGDLHGQAAVMWIAEAMIRGD